MDRATPSSKASERLSGLVGRLLSHRGFGQALAALEEGGAATLDGVWGSSCALCAAALTARAPATVVLVTALPDDADDLADDLPLFTRTRVDKLPALESPDREQVLRDELFGDRIRLLKALDGPQPPAIVATSVQALLQPVPSRGTVAAQTRRIVVGEEVSIDSVARWLVENGFHNTSAVELPGEFSVRGGLVDIFAPDWFDPVRLEFFGDQIDSIRRFDVASQRSLSKLDAVDLTMLDPGDLHDGYLTDWLPADSWIVLIEPEEIAEQGRHYLERLERPGEAHAVPDLLARITRFPNVTASAIAASSYETTCQLAIESIERFSGDIAKVREELDAVGLDQDVFVVCQTDAEIQRLHELLHETRLASKGRLHFARGQLKAGFRLVAESVVLISSGELFHRADLRRRSRRRLGRVIDSFVELKAGDLVVHVSHGIARYRGIKLLEKGRQTEEHLELEFHGGTRLYVPASKIGLVQKYLGGTKVRPRLATLGGSAWQRRRQSVENAVTDMAADMLELQAARAARPGITFQPDSQWQREFDASFPYRETDDQTAAIESIKRDMTAPRPMDRLICGDVGFGKTEVAMRAAFKAVDAGYQVAVLVPTTILAEQHLRTFTDRMAEFPFEIAALSRFSTKKQQRQTIERLADGSIDVVVGTHRLAQHDVRFQNLGLLIIDEEQRFGVDVKERLKALRQTVDVMTMTATPIPRTLHMSLLGLRDISNLETPPEDRVAVETRVTRFDPDMIRHAVLRELNRNGQVFFVHNRVSDIENVAAKLRNIAPEATIAVGHAQMPEHELEQVMIDFVDHKFDILVSTTIVESGLDIPNANTIFIDEAERYGLADLHQLRGRVGRYKHRAYCYLLLDPNKHVTPVATRRLRAIEEFSELGAGFSLAMRDLEIRGAGNILGTQQSGHIAMVGYELYCQLLEDAVRRLKRMKPRTSIDVDIDLPCEAFIPRPFVPDHRLKIDLYRRLARVTQSSELADLRAELLDRFGPPPPEVERLLTLAELRIAAHGWGIGSIHVEDTYLVLRYTDRARVEQLARRSGNRLRVVDDVSAYLPLKKEVTNFSGMLVSLKSLLRPA